MMRALFPVFIFVYALNLGGGCAAAEAPTHPSAGPVVRVGWETNTGRWRVAGTRHRLAFNPTNLACEVEAPGAVWRLAASPMQNQAQRSPRPTPSI